MRLNTMEQIDDTAVGVNVSALASLQNQVGDGQAMDCQSLAVCQRWYTAESRGSWRQCHRRPQTD